MLTCVVNRSINWYKCTITNSLQQRNIVRNCLLDAQVFSSGWHRWWWWWLYANYCPFQITLLSHLSDPGSAADTPWRQVGGTGWLVRAGGGARCGIYLETESNSLSSSRSLRQPSIWYFLPSPQSSAGRREREERGNCRPGLQDTLRLMGLSPPPLLLQISGGWEHLSQVCAVVCQHPPALFVCLRHFLFE